MNRCTSLCDDVTPATFAASRALAERCRGLLALRRVVRVGGVDREQRIDVGVGGQRSGRGHVALEMRADRSVVEVGADPPAGQVAGVPAWQRRRVRPVARLVVAEPAGEHLAAADDIHSAIGTHERLGEHARRPIPVREHHARDLHLQCGFEADEVLAVPRQERRSLVPGVKEWTICVQCHRKHRPVQRGVLIVDPVLVRRWGHRIDDVRLHLEERLEEGPAFVRWHVEDAFANAHVCAFHRCVPWPGRTNRVKCRGEG